MLWKSYTQYVNKFGKQQWRQDWKRSIFIPISKKGNAKECSNYHTISLISHASKVIHIILQARLQQYVNHELPDVQAGFQKGRGTRDQIANICWIMEKARDFQKTSISALLTVPKPLTVWITINWKFWKKVKSLSCDRLFVTPWTVAYQASLFVGFSRQEYWSRLPFPSPGDLPNPGIEPGSLAL